MFDALRPGGQTDALMKRVWRMGWVLVGNHGTAQNILSDQLMSSNDNPLEGPFDDRLENGFRWAFQTLDRACLLTARTQRIIPFRTGHELTDRLHRLPYELRVAALLIIVEDMSAERAGIVSDRSPFALSAAAATAASFLSA